MALLTCRDLVLGYEAPITGPLNFEVNEGDYLCIIGENGAGKSTLIKTLLKLVKPYGGTFTLEGANTSIGYLPQQSQVQKDFPATVTEVVLSGTLTKSGLRPFYTKEQKETAARNMRALGIYELRKKSFRNLSGGQQQRVLLARALSATDGLLLLDEPVNGLDPMAMKEFYDIIASLNRNKTTIIMVSHDINVATKYASHILHMGKTKTFFVTADKYLMSNAWSNILAKGGNEDVR